MENRMDKFDEENLHAGQSSLMEMWEKLWEQIVVVFPIVAYLVFFKVVVLGVPLNLEMSTVLGLLFILIGLVLFMDGLRYGIMPLGEAIGIKLPRHLSHASILLVAWVLGVGVTFAEPAVGALQTLGSLVECDQAPYLYVMLNEWTLSLVLSIGAGVGIAAMLGMLRLLYHWSIKPVIYVSVCLTLGLSLFVWTMTGVSEILGLAWDCGAVTTGPVTVPVVIALGIGLASASDHEASPLVGFGIVTLASLYPVLTVLTLGMYLELVLTPEQIVQDTCQFITRGNFTLENALEDADPNAEWYEKSPYNEVVLGVRAVVPLIGFLLALSKYISYREGLRNYGTEGGIELGSFRDPKGQSGYTKVRVHSPMNTPSATPPLIASESPEPWRGTPESDIAEDSALEDFSMENLELGKGPSTAPPKGDPLDSAFEQQYADEEGLQDTSFESLTDSEPGAEASAASGTVAQEELRGPNGKPYKEGRVLNEIQVAPVSKEGAADMAVVSLHESTECPDGVDDNDVGSELRPPTEHSLYGLLALLFGLLLFNEGLTYGLNRMGSETGMIIPAAFAKNDYVPGSPLFGYSLGVSVSVSFAFILGVGATFAEPALRVLGEKVEELTDGSMAATTLVRSVAAGVSVGVSLGVLKIIYDIDLMYFLLPLYPFAMVLTYFSRDEVVAVAWDSAGVTTSEVTVPIVLSLGLGVGNALHASDGFGILSLASIGPIISVLISGLCAEVMQRTESGYRVVSPDSV